MKSELNQRNQQTWELNKIDVQFRDKLQEYHLVQVLNLQPKEKFLEESSIEK